MYVFFIWDFPSLCHFVPHKHYLSFSLYLKTVKLTASWWLLFLAVPFRPLKHLFVKWTAGTRPAFKSKCNPRQEALSVFGGTTNTSSEVLGHTVCVFLMFGLFSQMEWRGANSAFKNMFILITKGNTLDVRRLHSVSPLFFLSPLSSPPPLLLLSTAFWFCLSITYIEANLKSIHPVFSVSFAIQYHTCPPLIPHCSLCAFRMSLTRRAMGTGPLWRHLCVCVCVCVCVFFEREEGFASHWCLTSRCV